MNGSPTQIYNSISKWPRKMKEKYTIICNFHIFSRKYNLQLTWDSCCSIIIFLCIDPFCTFFSLVLTLFVLRLSASYYAVPVKDKRRSTKHTHTTKDRAIRTSLKFVARRLNLNRFQYTRKFNATKLHLKLN
jgi:hypothetical protein